MIITNIKSDAGGLRAGRARNAEVPNLGLGLASVFKIAANQNTALAIWISAFAQTIAVALSRTGGRPPMQVPLFFGSSNLHDALAKTEALEVDTRLLLVDGSDFRQVT